MKQEIKENIYYLKDDQGNVLLKITPSEIPGNQVIIETNKEVYSGPINLLNLSKID